MSGVVGGRRGAAWAARRHVAWLRGAALRRITAPTGPWPPVRVLLGAGSLLTGMALTGWVVTAHPLAGGVLALSAVPGLALVATAVGIGYVRLLPSALLLLGTSAGVAVLAVGTSAAGAAVVGVALVAVLELGRWSIERRIDPPIEDATEWPRLGHLAGTLIGGWLLGAVGVRVAAGGLALGIWGSVVGAFAVVLVLGAVAAIARPTAEVGRPRGRG